MINEILNEYFRLWGVCSFDKVKDNLHECRAKSRVPKNAKSVIVIAFPYLLDESNYSESNISKYAVVSDYHGYVVPLLDSVCKKLTVEHPENSFVPFADNSPVSEVYAACLAGIGVRGLNSLLLTEEYGSFVFIGEIITDLYIEPTGEKINGCVKCGKCKQACPNGAINENGIDKEKCLSGITQKKGELTEEEKQLIKKTGCAWGCDICQNVCPYNKNAKQTYIEEFTGSALPVVDINTPVEGRAFAWRGKGVIERNLKILDEK